MRKMVTVLAVVELGLVQEVVVQLDAAQRALEIDHGRLLAAPNCDLVYFASGVKDSFVCQTKFVHLKEIQ